MLCLLSTNKHHSSSCSISNFSTKFIFGLDQIATNIQSILISFQDFKIAFSKNRLPLSSTISSFKINSIFSCFFANSTQVFSALKVSLL